MSFYKLRALFCSPIAYTILLQNLLDGYGLTTEITSYNDLLVGIFWI